MPHAWHVPHLVPRRVGGLIIGATVLTLVLVGHAVDPRAAPLGQIALTAAIAVFYTTMAFLVLSSAPGHPVGRLMAAAGISACAAVLAASWPHWAPVSWLGRWLWWPPLVGSSAGRPPRAAAGP